MRTANCTKIAKIAILKRKIGTAKNRNVWTLKRKIVNFVTGFNPCVTEFIRFGIQSFNVTFGTCRYVSAC